MARKSGCPTSIRDWQIDILSRVSTTANPEWIHIKGLTSISVSEDTDTEDGSSADSLYGEPYVTKRNSTISLEGRPVVDRVTGAHDRGQEELNYYATVGGCDGDATIRIIDNCGHAELIDCIVTSKERSADESSETVSWELQRVGESQEVPYVQVSSIATTPANSKSIAVGETATIQVTFTPATASNQKYSVASGDTSKVKVTNFDSSNLSFDITGVSETSTPVNIQVKSMNNAKIATLAVTVTSI